MSGAPPSDPRAARRPPRPETGPDQVARWLAGHWHLEHRRGYRFSPELELIPDFLAADPPRGRIVELGAGNGALLLAALSQAPAHTCQALGLELQAQLPALAARNAALRGLPQEVLFVRGDLRRPPLAPGQAEWVLANPPFFPPGWGRESRAAERHASTHELAGDLRAFVDCAARLLRPGGRSLWLYGPERLADLLACCAAADLLPARLLLVRHRARGTRVRVLLEAWRAGGAAPAAGLQVTEREVDYLAARESG